MASEIKVDTISEKTSANGVTIDGVNIKDSALATAGSVPLSTIDIDGGTDIGAAVVDADLFIIDDGAGGTNRKVAASRLKTYAGTTINNATVNEVVTIASTTTELDAEAKLLFDPPKLTIGNATAEDTLIVFDGNAKDFYIALDDSADKLVIGDGSTAGTNSILTLTDDSVTIGDASAVDTKIVFDGNAQDFHIGLDDSADDLVIGLGSSLGTTTHMAFDETGAVTKPLQPAFHVQHGNLSNKTGNGTQYAIVMSTENFDVNGDWSSATFTAPVTGKYFFATTVHFENITADKRTHLQINASNRALERYFQSDPESNAVDGAHLSGLIDMDASDTVQFRVTVHGVGADTVDLTDYSHYNGFLVC